MALPPYLTNEEFLRFKKIWHFKVERDRPFYDNRDNSAIEEAILDLKKRMEEAGLNVDYIETVLEAHKKNGLGLRVAKCGELSTAILYAFNDAPMLSKHEIGFPFPSDSKEFYRHPLVRAAIQRFKAMKEGRILTRRNFRSKIDEEIRSFLSEVLVARVVGWSHNEFTKNYIESIDLGDNIDVISRYLDPFWKNADKRIDKTKSFYASEKEFAAAKRFVIRACQNNFEIEIDVKTPYLSSQTLKVSEYLCNQRGGLIAKVGYEWKEDGLFLRLEAFYDVASFFDSKGNPRPALYPDSYGKPHRFFHFTGNRNSTYQVSNLEPGELANLIKKYAIPLFRCKSDNSENVEW